MTYVVTGPMALVDLKNGTTVSVMRDGVVPEDVKPEHLAHLLEVRLVKEVAEDVAAEAGGLEPTRAGDGSPAVQPDGTPDDPDGTPDDPDGPGGRPAKSALKEEWVAYAVAQGAEQADAEAQTKEDLIAAYGG